MTDPYYTDDEVEAFCIEFHDAYERAAVGAGWETQERSRKPWVDVPEANKATMRATVRAVLESPVMRAHDARVREATTTDNAIADLAEWRHKHG